MQLRPYQETLLSDARKALKSTRKLLLRLPTGGGKTPIAGFIASQSAQKMRVYFMCHRRELLRQTSMTFDAWSVPHGTITADQHGMTAHNIQICSVDTIKNRLDSIPVPGMVIWDECHHVGAEGWRMIIDRWPVAWHIGLTGTPIREDGTPLGDMFQAMVEGPSTGWLIDNGFLARYEIYAPPESDAGLTGDIVQHWLNLADHRRTIAFAPSVTFSQRMAMDFISAGIPAAHLDGNTPDKKRIEIMNRFCDGEIQILWNRSLFGEGLDIAALTGKPVTIDVLIDAQKTNSLSWHLQKYGRVLRRNGDMVKLILDHAGNSDRLGWPDDDFEWSLDYGGKKKKKPDSDEELPPATCLSCYRQLRQPAPNICPSCGGAVRIPAPDPKIAQAELKRQEQEERKRISLDKRNEQGMAKTMQDLVKLAVDRGYKNPSGWAYRIIQSRKHKK